MTSDALQNDLLVNCYQVYFAHSIYIASCLGGQSGTLLEDQTERSAGDTLHAWVWMLHTSTAGMP